MLFFLPFGWRRSGVPLHVSAQSRAGSHVVGCWHTGVGGYCGVMAKETTSCDLGLGEVHVTIEVVPQPVHSRLTKLFAGRRVRALVAVAGLAAGVAVGLIIVDSSDGGLSRGSGRSPKIPFRQPVNAEGIATRFGVLSHCVRQAIVSRDGTFARVDFDRATACGTAGNHVTLILRRVRGAWVAEFDATSWSCPSKQLPQRVLAGLHLCGER